LPEYDFHQLSPHDLEILARDVLQAHWGVRLESFKTGRDGGIDLRRVGRRDGRIELRCEEAVDIRYTPGPDDTIVQVKHYLRTGLRGLLRDLKAEAVKVRRLQPRRYVLVTSVPLSPADKDAIVTVIGADVLNPTDVFGAEDINNLLGQHPTVEARHFKLWLASRAILDRVVHNAAITRSEFKARQVYEQAKRFVASDAYPAALKMLEEERVAIIAGPPGVGKTTLADLLLYAHLERGYQAALIQRDITEGEQLFQTSVRQIFYFDDFMGATFAGDRFGADLQDRALLNFIAMVRASPSARLILTTREHVYARALDRSERLRQAGLGDLRVLLSMPSYNRIQRAKILYNHLYFSDLPDAYREELLRDDFYLRIVKHEKFNPRLIEWLSNYRRLHAVPVNRYRSFVENLLHDPSEIWRHAYEQEITDAGRSMLLALQSLGGKSPGQPLRAAFSALHQARAARYHFSTRPEDFRSGLREVANSFIKPTGAHSFEVIDPSVLDLMNAVIRAAPENAADMVEGAVCFDQIEQIWMFAKVRSNGELRATLAREAPHFIPTVSKLAIEDRRTDLGGGSIGYRGLTYERRLTIIVEMAEQLASADLAVVVATTMARLKEEWTEEETNINDAVELLRALKAAHFLSASDGTIMCGEVQDAILNAARRGCRAEELRELLGVLDAGTDLVIMEAAQTSFASFEQKYFSDDLWECRSQEQFDSLVEDLELFRDKLGANVERLVERVKEAEAEFAAQENDRGDHMRDEWKERYYSEREDESSIADMFGSLRDDRT
jgi:hypothetical protein